MTVAKFGGTSMADAMQIRKVAMILSSDDRYGVAVVSAPGRRSREDRKITDLLYEAYDGGDDAFDEVLDRIRGIETELGISSRASDEFASMRGRFSSVDEAVSRGEYCSAVILAEYTGREFVDSADMIVITDDGEAAADCHAAIRRMLHAGGKYVVPGFYGRGADGGIKTFSRGGSDITGSVLAAALSAERYENWTDVSGVFAADPSVVDNPASIKEMTYRELELLADHGAQVFHPLAVKPVRDRIPVVIKNTNRPSDPGTAIVAERDFSASPVLAVTMKDGIIYVIGDDSVIASFSVEGDAAAELRSVYDRYFRR